MLRTYADPIVWDQLNVCSLVEDEKLQVTCCQGSRFGRLGVGLSRPMSENGQDDWPTSSWNSANLPPLLQVTDPAARLSTPGAIGPWARPCGALR